MESSPDFVSLVSFGDLVHVLHAPLAGAEGIGPEAGHADFDAGDAVVGLVEQNFGIVPGHFGILPNAEINVSTD